MKKHKILILLSVAALGLIDESAFAVVGSSTRFCIGYNGRMQPCSVQPDGTTLGAADGAPWGGLASCTGNGLCHLSSGVRGTAQIGTTKAPIAAPK